MPLRRTGQAAERARFCP